MRLQSCEWRGPVPNQSIGALRPASGLVLHVIVGSLMSADHEFHQSSSEASAHFGVGLDGRRVQWVDTADKAWAQVDGNARWYSVETEGSPDQALTAAQVVSVAVIFAELARLDGFPLQLTDDPNGQGLIGHVNGGKAWGNHSCPGPLRLAQRGRIVARARQINAEGIGTILGPSEAPGPDGRMVAMGYPFTLTTTNVADWREMDGLGWILDTDGAVYASPKANAAGAGIPGVNGQPYFAGRTAARLHVRVEDGRYVGTVEDTAGELYRRDGGPPFRTAT